MTIQLHNPLHLYRALLRETTYLFDENVRYWAYGQVKSSFGKKVGRTQDDGRAKIIPRNPDRVPSRQERESIKRAQKLLTQLIRANQGYVRDLRNITQYAYGRKGRLKRELAAQILQLDQKETSKPIVADKGEQGLEHGSEKKPQKFSQGWKPSEEFLSLLGTQSQLSSYLGIKRSLRLKPSITEKNKAGVPMPASRVKNKTKQWYGHMAKALMPPLPEHEWDRLKAIVMGKQEFKIIPRRPIAKRIVESQQDEDAELAAKTILSGSVKPVGYYTALSIRSPHRLTPRHLSRLYAQHIFNHVPLAKPNPDGHGLVSKWDTGNRNVYSPLKPTDDAQIEALFG